MRHAAPLLFASLMFFAVVGVFSVFAEGQEVLPQDMIQRSVTTSAQQEAHVTVAAEHPNVQATKAAKRDSAQATIAAQRENAKVTVAAKREEVTKVIEAVVAKAKDRYIAHIDSLISRLQSIRVRVSGRIHLTDEQKQEIYAEIDTFIEELEKVKGLVHDAESREDLHDIRETMLSLWREARLVRSRAVGYVMVARFKLHVDKAQGVAVKIQERLDAVQSDQVDTSAVSSALATFSSEIAAAKESIDEAQVLFKTMTDPSSFESGVRTLSQAKEKLHSAGGALRDAIESLRVVVE